MNKSKYTPKGSSRQEAVTRANIIRWGAKTKLGQVEHGEWKPGGDPTDYVKYVCLGYEVRLRFGYVWTAYCPHFNSEIQFANRTDEAMVIFLSDWLTAHIDQPQAPSAQHRQATPAVLYMAEYHDIAIPLADEIMRGR